MPPTITIESKPEVFGHLLCDEFPPSKKLVETNFDGKIDFPSLQNLVSSGKAMLFRQSSAAFVQGLEDSREPLQLKNGEQVTVGAEIEHNEGPQPFVFMCS